MLSASEALYGFAGWLTSQEHPVTFSAYHESGTAAELVHAFCEVQGLPEPRDGWQHDLHPMPAHARPPRHTRITDLFRESAALSEALGALPVLTEIGQHNPIVAGALAAQRANPDTISLEQVMLVSILALDAAVEKLAATAVDAIARRP